MAQGGAVPTTKDHLTSATFVAEALVTLGTGLDHEPGGRVAEPWNVLFDHGEDGVGIVGD
jgi:hypothetical protein